MFKRDIYDHMSDEEKEMLNSLVTVMNGYNQEQRDISEKLKPEFCLSSEEKARLERRSFFLDTLIMELHLQVEKRI